MCGKVVKQNKTPRRIKDWVGDRVEDPAEERVEEKAEVGARDRVEDRVEDPAEERVEEKAEVRAQQRMKMKRAHHQKMAEIRAQQTLTMTIWACNPSSTTSSTATMITQLRMKARYQIHLNQTNHFQGAKETAL